MTEGTGMKAITFVNGDPKLVEVVAVTGKRARIRRPDSPLNSEVRSLPLAELYTFDEEIWNELMTRVEKLKIIRKKMAEISNGLRPLSEELQIKAGGTDDFWA